MWFDTFMMHESEFKHIAAAYKTLRQEKVIFPKRDPNSQYFIKFDGKKSPIFEAIENNQIYEVGSVGTAEGHQPETGVRSEADGLPELWRGGVWGRSGEASRVGKGWGEPGGFGQSARGG